METILFFYQDVFFKKNCCYAITCRKEKTKDLIKWQKDIHKHNLEQKFRKGKLVVKIIDDMTLTTYTK